ncbi:protein TonB [Archangium gephyra]|uniref:Protein TonB n=1 Tax=Archangium gephyra TaxID=48 RepID=A0AAC8QCL5_9BACT|nr:energy transducer TonB [Archangium gephyra]AKJ04850.1 Ferric siderophore transport system, periplasmic binding protein TonB [Archangium gephyra]REG37105.1 protein TonB [Archangium gephyra]
MFQSVINQPGLSAGRFGTGMWVSLMVHAGVFAGMLGLSGKAVDKIRNEPEIVFNVPQPPKGNPNPPKQMAATTPKPKPKPKTELVQPKKIPPPPPEETKTVEAAPPPEDTEPETEELPYIPGSDPNGVEVGGIPGAKAIAGLALGNIGQSTGEEILPFGAGMTPPQLVSTGVPLQYTYDALRARVSGVIIAKCTITREGDVENCRIIKGLPFMDDAVLQSVTSRQYRPVTFQGRPVNVSYTFTVNLKLP